MNNKAEVNPQLRRVYDEIAGSTHHVVWGADFSVRAPHKAGIDSSAQPIAIFDSHEEKLKHIIATHPLVQPDQRVIIFDADATLLARAGRTLLEQGIDVSILERTTMIGFNPLQQGDIIDPSGVRVVELTPNSYRFQNHPISGS